MSKKSPISFSSVLDGFGEKPVIALSITQTLGYGALYYSFGVLATSISKDFGVGLDVFFGIFSLGLLFGGLAAPIAGRMLDQRGARAIMSVGSVCTGAALTLLAFAPNLWTFALGVVLLEFAACFVLYEAAFAALTQIYKYEARQRITAITLVAGFASTIFWPLTVWLESQFGWRGTFIIFGLAQLVIPALLHWFTLKEANPVAKIAPDASIHEMDQPHLTGQTRERAFLLYAVAVCVSGIAYAAIPVHMLKIIENEGFSAQAAAWVAMVMGPAQVMARVVEISYGQRFDALMTGRIALTALAGSLLLLAIGSGASVIAIGFAAFYGISQGLMSIARGTVPLQLFGVRGYATIVGRVTGLRFIVNAGAPFAFAAIWTHIGANAAIIALFGISLVALMAFVLLPKPVAAH
ncbi:MAG: MFS transporter, partial [Rhabdaerophilum sp.]